MKKIKHDDIRDFFIRNNNKFYVALVALLTIALCIAVPFFIPVGILILLVVGYFAWQVLENPTSIPFTDVNDLLKHAEKGISYAARHLDVAMAVFGSDGKFQTGNENFRQWTGVDYPSGRRIEELLGLEPNSFATMCVKDGEKIIELGDRRCRLRYARLKSTKKGEEPSPKDPLAVYLTDVTEVEELKKRCRDDRLCLVHFRFDNYEDVMKGLSETARANVSGAVSEAVNVWAESMGGFVSRTNKENSLVGFKASSLEKAVSSSFDVLEKVRQVRQENKMQPTLSIGASIDGESLEEVESNARRALDIALSRGGDQAVVIVDNKISYYGGTQASGTTASTRVRVRIVAKSIREQMEKAEKIIVMGHANEDYDLWEVPSAWPRWRSRSISPPISWSQIQAPILL